MEQSNQKRCDFCGMPLSVIWVHGHGQCAHCKINAFPCCDGDECAVGPDKGQEQVRAPQEDA